MLIETRTRSTPKMMRSIRPGTLLAKRAPTIVASIEAPPATGRPGQKTNPIV